MFIDQNTIPDIQKKISDKCGLEVVVYIEITVGHSQINAAYENTNVFATIGKHSTVDSITENLINGVIKAFPLAWVLVGDGEFEEIESGGKGILTESADLYGVNSIITVRTSDGREALVEVERALKSGYLQQGYATFVVKLAQPPISN